VRSNLAMAYIGSQFFKEKKMIEKLSERQLKFAHVESFSSLPTIRSGILKNVGKFYQSRSLA
jgi:hypothetical protein